MSQTRAHTNPRTENGGYHTGMRNHVPRTLVEQKLEAAAAHAHRVVLGDTRTKKDKKKNQTGKGCPQSAPSHNVSGCAASYTPITIKIRARIKGAALARPTKARKAVDRAASQDERSRKSTARASTIASIKDNKMGLSIRKEQKSMHRSRKRDKCTKAERWK